MMKKLKKNRVLTRYWLNFYTCSNVYTEHFLKSTENRVWKIIHWFPGHDLRASSLSRSSLWIAHSMYSYSVESVFSQINRFSDDYGPKEIIIINIHQIFDFQYKEIKELNRLITKYFASKVATIGLRGEAVVSSLAKLQFDISVLGFCVERWKKGYMKTKPERATT